MTARTDLVFNPLAVPTMRDEDLCHVSEDEDWGGSFTTVCGLTLPEEPRCCSPADPSCGRPRCPECAMLARGL